MHQSPRRFSDSIGALFGFVGLRPAPNLLSERQVDIAAWLAGLGLERYEPAFRENEIDLGILPSLTTDDLKDLGVVIVGHRRKLQEAIAGLKVALAHAAVPPSSTPAGSAAQPDAERRQLTVMFV